MAGPRRTCKRLPAVGMLTEDPVYPIELRRGGTKAGFGRVGGAVIRDRILANSPEEADWLCATWMELGKKPKKWSQEWSRNRLVLESEL